MRHRRALDEQPVAFEADDPRLFATDPGFVPGSIDLGDDLAVLDAIVSGIGDHGLECRRALFVGFGNGAALGGDNRDPQSVRRCDLAASGMLAVDRRAHLALLVLIDHGDELPAADDPLFQILVVGAGRQREKRHEAKAKQIGSHGRSPSIVCLKRPYAWRRATCPRLASAHGSTCRSASCSRPAPSQSPRIRWRRARRRRRSAHSPP